MCCMSSDEKGRCKRFLVLWNETYPAFPFFSQVGCMDSMRDMDMIQRCYCIPLWMPLCFQQERNHPYPKEGARPCRSSRNDSGVTRNHTQHRFIHPSINRLLLKHHPHSGPKPLANTC